MGRICPILNHPLNDGVLIEDEALVNFIHKRNVDFLASELVCRSCKRDVTKLYQKKLQKAKELHRSRYMDGSISTLKTSKDSSSSSGASATSEYSVSRNDLQQGKRVEAAKIQNGKDSSLSETSTSRQRNNSKVLTNGSINTSQIIAVSENSVQILANYNYESSMLRENQQNMANIQKSIPANYHSIGNDALKNVTIRKKTIKDFLTARPKEATATAKTQEKAIEVYRTEIHVPVDSQLDNGNVNEAISMIRQEPTTSKISAASNLNSSVFKHYTKATKNGMPGGQEESEAIPKIASAVKKKIVTRHVTSDDDVDVIRRLSQEPTTSKAAAAATNINPNKRPISKVIDSDDDDDDDDDDQPQSLNAFNGTRLPQIQPLPPKRKSLVDKPGPISRDIMDDYIKTITGG